MLLISSRSSLWNTMTSSTRLRNSGRKTRLSSAGDAALHVLVAHALARRLREAQRRVLGDHLRADVARHDEDGVAEVHRAALGVGQSPSSRICSRMLKTSGCAFLDLVEKMTLYGLRRHHLGELAAPRRGRRSRRRADEPRHGVLLHVLAHVDLHEWSSSPNRNAASVRASSVLPTPDGPRR